jgi:hypothetical protein
MLKNMIEIKKGIITVFCIHKEFCVLQYSGRKLPEQFFLFDVFSFMA